MPLLSNQLTLDPSQLLPQLRRFLLRPRTHPRAIYNTKVLEVYQVLERLLTMARMLRLKAEGMAFKVEEGERGMIGLESPGRNL